MSRSDRSYLAPTLLVDELVRAGVRQACVTPGSRSTPLALTIARHPGLRTWSHVDERSAGFFALGIAKVTRAPVVLACTSGTAAANFMPAVVEAFYAQVPLVVLTADRPPELRDCSAGQTIDQLRLFGTHARWFVEVGTAEATPEAMRWVRTLACRAVAAATGPPAGPVHLNLPFREPLVLEVAAGCVGEETVFPAPPAACGRRGDAPYAEVHAPCPAPDPDAVERVARVIARAERPILVGGPLDDPDPTLPAAVVALARALAAPVLAEPASNLRRPTLAPWLVDAPDMLVRSARFADAYAPDAVLRLGAPPTSKVLATWLARGEATPQVVLDGTGGWPEPAGVASHVLRGAPALSCLALARALGQDRHVGAWLRAWRRGGETARSTLARAAAEERAPFEADAVAALAILLPPEAILYVGNSLAIRDLDWFWPASAPPVRVLANRGANGIDGFVSSVLGAAASGLGPVVGLCGDLAFYHDLNGLLAVRRYGVPAVLLVLNNDGGGIFDHLPVSRCGPEYEELFVTPHGLDFQPIVEAYGARFERVASAAALAPALARALVAPIAAVVELRIERQHSLAAHRRTWARATAALEEST